MRLWLIPWIALCLFGDLSHALLGGRQKTISYDYPTMFTMARDLLTNETVKIILRQQFATELTLTPEQQKKYGSSEKIKDISMSQMIVLLQHNPKIWHALQVYIDEDAKLKSDENLNAGLRLKLARELQNVLKDARVNSEFKKYNDPTEPVFLKTEDGSLGYSNPKMYVNHERIYEDGTTQRPDDLRQVFIDFFCGAEKEVAFNVYEFDLLPVAEAIVDCSRKKKIKFKIGMDMNSFKSKPEIQAVVEKLVGPNGLKKLLGEEKTFESGNILIHTVDPVGLDHQKLATRDWSLHGKGKVLFSSANLTQSCSGPEGDCWMMPESERPPFSLPNANHIVVLDSDLYALIVHSNLELTLSPKFQLRGNQFPLNGTFGVFGDKTQDESRSPYGVISFTPRGANGNVNVDIIGRVIREGCGPIKMLQFAFSSTEVEDALYECAKELIKQGKPFDFKSVGDATFNGRDFSIFLKMSCLTLSTDASSNTPILSETKNCRWKKLLGSRYQELRDSIRTGPKGYGIHTITYQGEPLKVDAKIHHKMLLTEWIAILASSFNFSANAEKNNEHIFVTVRDPYLLREARAMFEGLYQTSSKSVYAAEMKKNFYKSQQDNPKNNNPNPDPSCASKLE